MFGDQTIGATTRKKDIATITNGTGRNTCKRKEKTGLGNKLHMISCIIHKSNNAVLATFEYRFSHCCNPTQDEIHLTSNSLQDRQLF